MKKCVKTADDIYKYSERAEHWGENEYEKWHL